MTHSATPTGPLTEGRLAAPHSAITFALIFAFVFVLHIPLLRLPYFWDEAGYYIPAARDLLLTGSLIPQATPSNAHPPLVMAYLALWWKLVGFSPVVTRGAILLISASALQGVFRLAQRVANTEVAIASTLCSAIYPVFFAQSSLAHPDLAAAGLTFWGLSSYFEDRAVATAVWFSLAALTKETAIVAPLALAAWWMFQRSLRPGSNDRIARVSLAAVLAPALPLALWYGFHFIRTGNVFGNPEFFRYNVQATLNPLRIVLALGLRLWQAFGYMQLGLLTLAMLLAVWCPPLREGTAERPRIPIPTQLTFLAIITAYVIAMSFVGGAVLARYMLPVVPLVIIVAISTLWRRVRYWRGIVLIATLAFAVALFTNPPYGFSPEDNLAYRDYILLHEDAETFLEARRPMARVLTAWPASDELTHPYLGYVTRPMRIVRIEDFTLEQLASAAELRSQFDVALVFSTKYEPSEPVAHWAAWERLKTRFFGFHRDLPPAAAAQILGGHMVFIERRKGQWVAIIEIEKIEEATACQDQDRAMEGRRLQIDHPVSILPSNGTNASLPPATPVSRGPAGANHGPRA